MTDLTLRISPAQGDNATQLRFVSIANKLQNALHRCDELDLTRDAFELELRRARRGEARGAAGTKQDEEQAKDGYAIVPLAVDWSQPACACLIVSKSTPFCVHYGCKPDAPSDVQHRHKHTARTMSAAVFLDLDEQTREQVDAALGAMEHAGLDFVAWSSHSYGRADRAGKCPCRIVVFCSREYEASKAELVRQGVADAFGVALDPQCRQPAALFYWPSCPNDPQRIRMAWVRRSTARGLLDPDSALGEGAQRVATRRAARERSHRVALATPGEVVKLALPEHHQKAGADLNAFCELLAKDEGAHVRAKLSAMAWWCGRYAAAGALKAEAACAALHKAVDAREQVVHEGAHAAARHVVVDDQFARGMAEPALPDLEHDAGYERLLDMLDLSIPKEPPIPAAEVGQRLGQLFGGFDPASRKLHVVQITPGAGKTRAMHDYIRQDSSDETHAIVVPTHALIKEQIERLRPVSAKWVRSPASIVDGEPNCDPDMRATVKRVVREKLSPSRVLCPTCDYRAVCPFMQRQREEARVTVATHQVPLEALYDSRRLWVDEEPELFEHMEIPDVASLRRPINVSMLADQGGALARVQGTLAAGTSPDSWDVWQAAAEDVAPRKGLSWDQLKAHAPTLEAMAVLRSVRTLCRGFEQGQQRRTLSRLVARLRSEGGVVLSATPNAAVWRALGAEIHTVDVADGCEGTTRQVLYFGQATRGRATSEGKCEGEELKRAVVVLREALRRARGVGCQRILVVTFKAVAEALRARVAELAGGLEVELQHYEVVRGVDRWRDWEGFVTLFDPRPGGGHDFDESTETARGHLAQAHGRARDPQRKTPAWHLHVGTIAPLGWHSDNTTVDMFAASARGGRPRRAAFGPPVSLADFADFF